MTLEENEQICKKKRQSSRKKSQAKVIHEGNNLLLFHSYPRPEQTDLNDHLRLIFQEILYLREDLQDIQLAFNMLLHRNIDIANEGQLLNKAKKAEIVRNQQNK